MATEKKNEHGLTLRQQTVCDLYRASENPDIRGNKKLSYQAVYGCTDKSAEHNGPRMFKNPNVVAYLNSKAAKAMEAADITEQRIVEELANIAFLDPSDFFDDKGSLMPIHSMPERARRALAGLESFEEYEGKGEDRETVGMTRKIKFTDKKGTLEMLMRYLGLFKHDLKIPEGMGGVMLFPADTSVEEWQRQHYQQPDQKGK